MPAAKEAKKYMLSVNNFSDPDFPIQYKEGCTFFCGNKIFVTADTLIPRPETEAIVKDTIEIINKHFTQTEIRIADIGTGSGCIAISIAKKVPNAKITAVDISDKALAIAKKNAKYNNVQNQIEFLQNDMLENVKKNFDIIVANLPYIPSARIPFLDRSVRDFEPNLALDGGIDGFERYRELFNQISKMPVLPKYMLFEIDDTHGNIALKEAANYFSTAKIEIKKDFTNLDRLLLISL